MAGGRDLLARRRGGDSVHPAARAAAAAPGVGAAGAHRCGVRAHARAAVGEEGAARAHAARGQGAVREARARSLAAGGAPGMGVLIDGRWRDEELAQETSARGEFARIHSVFRDRITADGSSGYKAEAGRYHLYIAWNCPWAHRVLIFLALKKLDHAFTVAYAIPGLREQGWTFESNPQFPD